MGLKQRKIKTMIEEHAEQCIQNLNTKLGTEFVFDIDWNCLPEDVDRWNWVDKELQECFYNSYFHPIETAFSELFKDNMYKEAITEQIHGIKIMGGDYSIGCDFSNNQFVYKHIMSVNQRELHLNAHFNATAVRKITEVIDHQLS